MGRSAENLRLSIGQIGTKVFLPPTAYCRAQQANPANLQKGEPKAYSERRASLQGKPGKGSEDHNLKVFDRKSEMHRMS